MRKMKKKGLKKRKRQEEKGENKTVRVKKEDVAVCLLWRPLKSSLKEGLGELW